MPQITPDLVLTIMLVAAAAMLAGIALRGWLSRQPQSQVAVNLEAEAFKMLTAGIEHLGNTHDQDKIIASQMQIKATKARLLLEAATELQAKAGTPS